MDQSAAPQPSHYQQPTTAQPKSKKKLIWGLVCLLGPTTLVIVSVILYAIVNLATGGDSASNNDPLAQPSPIHTISNVVLFFVGAVATLTWLPGIIIGVILLATRK